MGRITKIKGEFMGVNFETKATPIRFDKLIDQRKDMLMQWYKDNVPSVHEKLSQDTVSFEDFSNEELEGINKWKLDETFRADYLKFIANTCMKFDKPIPEEVWASDELELSTIEEAWDFFIQRRQIP